MNWDTDSFLVQEGRTYTRDPQTELKQLDAVVAKIHAFEKLPDGWHFGRGEKIIGASAVSAQKIAAIGIQNGYRVEIFPGPDRDILVALRKGEFYYEVIANADKTISFFQEKAGVEIDSGENETLSKIITKLNIDNNFVWSTFISYTPITGSQQKADLSASPSEIPAPRTAGEFLLSTPNVR